MRSHQNLLNVLQMHYTKSLIRGYMSELVWLHKLGPNELGIRGDKIGGGCSIRVPSIDEIVDFLPTLNEENDFSTTISLSLIVNGNILYSGDDITYKDARFNDPKRTEFRIYLKSFRDYIGPENTGKVLEPNKYICIYKKSNDFYVEVVPNDSLYVRLLASKTDALSNLLGEPELQNSDVVISTTPLSKPFILLAGISGTGKTRFVRQQAELTGSLEENYQLISVRPDWHEPSDLLGYISRLNPQGAEFIVTGVVKFIVKAWLSSLARFDTSEVNGENTLTPIYKNATDVKPYWLCLDEMNLAPVEQYFADYLSVLETRHWKSHIYSCDALLSPNIFSQLEAFGLEKLRKELGLEGTDFEQTWQYFQQSGICIPFNLLVAGTVNMDETTHGFSRKVIDRALTFDFGEFFPNNYLDFFDPKSKPKTLGFPSLSSVNSTNELNHVVADNDGAKSIAFLHSVNNVLKSTPFELAFRALNELLVSIHCFSPKDNVELQTVWDDFLMCKVLPRIEGDEDKLAVANSNILTKLSELLTTELSSIWPTDMPRPDLLSEGINDHAVIMTTCRSKKKIEKMQQKLDNTGFTSYWP